jgi:hypothetical protein
MSQEKSSSRLYHLREPEGAERTAWHTGTGVAAAYKGTPAAAAALGVKVNTGSACYEAAHK